MDALLEDKRKIMRISFLVDGGNDEGYVIGSHSISTVNGSTDEIRTCEVNGQMASVVWFEVMRKGTVFDRINSAFVSEVSYVTTEP